MMTYKEYLEDYVKEMNDSGTLDLTSLCTEIMHGNYRLRGPFVMYVIESGQIEDLPDESLRSICKEVGNYLAKKEPLPREYYKVQRSYHSYLLRCQESCEK